MTKEKAIILRKIEKQLKKELYELRIKMYYLQQTLTSIRELISTMDVFNEKKKILVLIKFLRRDPNNKLLIG